MARKRQNEEPENVDMIDLGKEAGLTLMTDETSSNVVDVLPLMLPELDEALGGGIPFRRVTELYGKNGSGKSIIAVRATQQAIKYGIPVVWADVENTTSTDNLRQLGVDPEKVFAIKPAEGEYLTIEGVTEKIKEIIDVFSRVGKPVLIIWDSLASTNAEQELKDGFNHQQRGVVAKSITHMTRAIGQSISQHDVAFLILNQARADQNSMYGGITSTGGEAMQHWCSLRLELNKSTKLTVSSTDKTYIGHTLRTKVIKSKLSAPETQATSYLLARPFKGVDFMENLYRSAVDQFGLISKGAWRNYISDAGEEIKLRDKEWVPFLESSDGEKIAKELFVKQMLIKFPYDYVGFKNKHIDLTVEPYFEELKKHYNTA